MQIRRCLLPAILCSHFLIGALIAYSLSIQAAVAATGVGEIPLQTP